jgi:hypothetical protein
MEVGAATSSPILESIIDQFQSTSLSASNSPCFPVQGKSHCLLTSGSVPTLNQLSMELGILLRNSFSSNDSWQKFLRKLHVPGAELLAFENQDNSQSNGGSAAGNLLWLIQSLGRTYSRTRELVEVYVFIMSSLLKHICRMPRQSISSLW